MAWMRCRSCKTLFAIGLLRCPQCRAVSELYAVPDHVAETEEENMPKITVGGGASNALEGEDPGADQTQAPDAPMEESAGDELVEDVAADEREESAGEAEAEPEPADKEAAPAPKTRKRATPAKS